MTAPLWSVIITFNHNAETIKETTNVLVLVRYSLTTARARSFQSSMTHLAIISANSNTARFSNSINCVINLIYNNNGYLSTNKDTKNKNNAAYQVQRDLNLKRKLEIVSIADLPQINRQHTNNHPTPSREADGNGDKGKRERKEKWEWTTRGLNQRPLFLEYRVYNFVVVTHVSYYNCLLSG